MYAIRSYYGEYQLEERWETPPQDWVAHPGPELLDHTSPSIWRDMPKCIECGLCVEACGVITSYSIHYTKLYDLPTPCAACAS